MPIRLLLASLAVAPLLTGCAAMLRGPDSPPEVPPFAEPLGGLMQRSQAAAPVDEALRAGLQAKAAAMLAGRQAKTQPSAPTDMPTPPARAASGMAASAAMPAAAAPTTPGRNAAVTAMLARAQAAPERGNPPRQSVETGPAVTPPVAVLPGPGKVQVRLGEGEPARNSTMAMIRFSPGSAEIEETDHHELARLAARTRPETGIRLVVTAGLAGTAPAWERMQLASRRLETVARTLPPSLAVERRFDPALDGSLVQVSIPGGSL